MSLGGAREPEQVMQVLPLALRRLRLGAGQTSIRGAARAIQKQTGTLVNAAMISQWEREGGHRPTFQSILGFLLGLGCGLGDLEREIEALLDRAHRSR